MFILVWAEMDTTKQVGLCVIDGKHTFNEFTCVNMLWNVHNLCALRAKCAFNSYSFNSLLLVRNSQGEHL